MREEARRLGIATLPRAVIVATVPPQHMYGFESTVLMALGNGYAFCAERPFYPADIATTLARVPRPRVLVSTPVHLRALAASGVTLPKTDLVVSATAPLSQQLAARDRAALRHALLEIYGSTETGQIAARRPTQTASGGCGRRSRSRYATGRPGPPAATSSSRRACATCSRRSTHERFLLHGRHADLVNIAGKRSSLAYLNHQLNSIPGVLDGAFFHFEHTRAPHTGVARVAACVVAPALTPAQLLEALRQRIDPVFLPRPLLFVARLPRNSTGKLPQEALRALAAAHLKASVA